jgi:hypothetical protein
MKTIRSWRTFWIFASALTLAASIHGEAHARTISVSLAGSGPVYTQAFSPGERAINFKVDTRNNLNVGFDIIDQRSGAVIANGTIKDRGSRAGTASAHAGRTYKLRLRCQEPRWNRTKCSAVGQVSW